MSGKRSLALACGLAVALALAGCAANDEIPPHATSPAISPPPILGAPVQLIEHLTGFTQPLLVTHDGIEGEIFVVEQTGKIWRVRGEGREVWLDLSASTAAGGERGLLGLAFDPDSDRAYVSYTDNKGDSVLERVRADKTRERLLFVDQPYGNHNGGHLAFGPDGMLYYGLGDGGSSGDPQGNGQDPSALLGSLLRLDVSDKTGYRSPPDNLRDEVWAKGLRNPWRFTFDRNTGELYIADVGQNRIEEINFLAKSAPAGANFGWNVYEGHDDYGVNPLDRTFSTHTPPVATYTHDDGCSVTGGYVYRGAMHEALVGAYFFADYCSGKLWALKRSGETWNVAEILDTDLSVSSFGEDSSGELYVVDHGGAVHRLVGTGAPLPV